MYSHSTASDDWHRRSEENGMRWDAAERAERYAALPPDVGPAPAKEEDNKPRNVEQELREWQAYLEESRHWQSTWDQQ